MEQLILLGADVKVALRQDDALKWPAKSVPYPCVLSERGRTHWVAKVKRLGMLQTRAEAISDSTFSLLHLAVRPFPWSTSTDPRYQHCSVHYPGAWDWGPWVGDAGLETPYLSPVEALHRLHHPCDVIIRILVQGHHIAALLSPLLSLTGADLFAKGDTPADQ